MCVFHKSNFILYLLLSNYYQNHCHYKLETLSKFFDTVNKQFAFEIVNFLIKNFNLKNKFCLMQTVKEKII